MKWINYAKQKPDRDQLVLVEYFRDLFVARYVLEEADHKSQFEQLVPFFLVLPPLYNKNQRYRLEDNHIKFWMPLPEPPKDSDVQKD